MMRTSFLLESDIMRFLGKALAAIICVTCAIVIIALCLGIAAGAVIGLGKLLGLLGWML